MSITSSLSNALSGLTAASRMAEVVSANLANAMTEGYGRRQLDLSSQSIGGRGAGVQIDGLSRLVDRGILADRRLSDAALSSQRMLAGTALKLESAVGAIGNPEALPARIAALEQALVTASTDPSSDVRLGTVVSRFNGVAAALNESAAGIRDLRQGADSAIAQQVDLLNTSLQQLEKLNIDIGIARNRGADALGLIDQRQTLVDRIGAIVPVREFDRPNGQIALMTTSGVMLLDGPPMKFGFTPVNYAVPEMTLASGGLSGLTRDGIALDPAKGIWKLGGGSLGAAFILRDETLVTAQAGLDQVARDLIERFANLTSDPSWIPGLPGLLTDAGLPFAGNTVGLAGRITVNPAINPARGGAYFRLRDGINAAGAGPVGDATQIDRWLDALAAPRALHTGGSEVSAASQASRLASSIGSARLVAEEGTSFATARWNALREAELSGGVDSDAEMQMLLRVEQSYAANARVIQTIQAMIQKLLEI